MKIDCYEDLKPWISIDYICRVLGLNIEIIMSIHNAILLQVYLLNN